MTRRDEAAEDLARIIDARTELETHNLFGQVSGGVLVMSAMLFRIPMPWALFDPQSHTSLGESDIWALSFDDFMNIDTAIPEQAFFIPLSKSFEASRALNLTICGIVVEPLDHAEDNNEYKRIGFAIVNEDDGHIANSGWYLENWISPPWSDTMMIDIKII